MTTQQRDGNQSRLLELRETHIVGHIRPLVRICRRSLRRCHTPLGGELDHRNDGLQWCHWRRWGLWRPSPQIEQVQPRRGLAKQRGQRRGALHLVFFLVALGLTLVGTHGKKGEGGMFLTLHASSINGVATEESSCLTCAACCEFATNGALRNLSMRCPLPPPLSSAVIHGRTLRLTRTNAEQRVSSVPSIRSTDTRLVTSMSFLLHRTVCPGCWT